MKRRIFGAALAGCSCLSHLAAPRISSGGAEAAVTRVAVMGRVALLTAVVVVATMMTGAGVAMAQGEPPPTPTEEELVRAETAAFGAEHAAQHAARRRRARES